MKNFGPNGVTIADTGHIDLPPWIRTRLSMVMGDNRKVRPATNKIPEH
jgi:hypothetical protein